MELIYLSCLGTAGLLTLALADFLVTKTTALPSSPCWVPSVPTHAPARNADQPPLRRAA